MPARHHEHCDRCHSVHCGVPLHVSLACVVVRCRQNCGAAFHACKEEEHRRLCPNETVPCLSAGYGCPLAMRRHRLAAHLEVCPASVVCCSQEWNRWPVSGSDRAFYSNVSEVAHAEPHLDVAVALGDQELLFRSIKMRHVFPELAMAEDPAARPQSPAEEAACCLDGGEFRESHSASVEEEGAAEEERDALAKSRDVQNYSSWEKIFSKEMKGEEQGKERGEEGSSGGPREKRNSCLQRENDARSAAAAAAVAASADGATGLAPWQDGVLERLGREVNIAEYNMYLVHNGTMLINFGQLAACTPREKDFVYGNLEPIEVRTIRSFNVPTSYRAKRNHLKDPARKRQTAHRSVDTADLGVSAEELPACDEVGATLLCSLEKEAKGHLISESVGIDGLYVDTGTQTYSFSSAPFRTDASLADVIADRPRGLHVHVEAEPVTRRHNKASSAFSYTCGHFFRRDEYGSHFRNVHCDIRSCLSGWLQQRCPLAYLGCTFAQTRLHPAGHQGSIKFCQDVSSFVLQPHASSSLRVSPRRNGSYSPDPLSRLPLEILQHIARHLDSFTLSQLSQASRLMRDVCATLLQERGMVSLKWEKKTYSHGGSSWKCRKKIWEFSSLFSPVDRWSFSDAPSMSDHLKTCAFYQREARTEPVVLACLGEVRDKVGEAKREK